MGHRVTADKLDMISQHEAHTDLMTIKMGIFKDAIVKAMTSAFLEIKSM